jgi:high-affinity nickel-transport protein
LLTGPPDPVLQAGPQEDRNDRSSLRRTYGLFSLLTGFNLAAWLWAVSAFHDRPALLGMATLAWVFGLRHAVDADHIAAIDNVVRKLLQDGRRAQSVGFWFSLGHSTVVILACLAIAMSAVAVQGWLDPVRQWGSVAGTLISGVFLIVIAVANIIILRRVWRASGLVRRGGRLDEAGLDRMLAARGFFNRLLRPLFSAINASWQMYPLGFLFGLGFDTATEIGLLGISATQASQGMSPWQAMVFPALFTAGMALVDTTDGVLMVHAYGWAFVNPLRKLWYNLTITAASVLVALLIGGIEVLGSAATQLSLHGPAWGVVLDLGGSLGDLGFAVVGVFAFCWIGSILAFRLRGYHRL